MTHPIARIVPVHRWPRRRRPQYGFLRASRPPGGRGAGQGTTTTCEGLDQALEQFPGASRRAGGRLTVAVVVEAPDSRRASQVLVADPRRVQLISKDPRKTDRRDAEVLARMAFGFPELLGNIVHRGEHERRPTWRWYGCATNSSRTRTTLVSVRPGHVQGHRACGCRSTSTAVPSERRSPHSSPRSLRPALDPLLEQIESLTAAIRDLDKKDRCAVRTLPGDELCSSR